MDPQVAAQSAFVKLGFLVLTNLPKGSEFGLDGQFWIVNNFNGVKLIPPGLHLFVFSAAPKLSSTNNPTTDGTSSQEGQTGSGLGVRHALFKVYRQDGEGEGEKVVESWDTTNESLAYSIVSSSSSNSTRLTHNPSKRKRRTIDSSSTLEEERNEETTTTTLVSREYLQTLDPTLAPYPSSSSEHTRKWKGLSQYVGERTIARVIGIDRKGIGRVDALVEGWREEQELVDAREKKGKDGRSGNEGKGEGEEGGGPGKTFWGKKRPEEEAEVKEIRELEEEEDGEGEGREGLEFARFEDKRSWPKGAVGEELSRWSKDKSWLLSHVVGTQFNGDAKELLAELQLSFILFTLVYNFSALSSYKSLFSLICRSNLLAHPSSSRPRDCDSKLPSPLLESEVTLPLFASFLSVIHSQMSFLDSNFFSTHLPSLESHLLSSLEHLRSSLSDASPHWYSLPTDSPASPIWKTLVSRWNELAATTMEKFGWDLGLIEGSKARYGKLKEELDQGGEVPFEELEEGEDAPVIVDLGDEDDEDAPILVGF